MNGLKVEVYNNNVDMALRKLKRKIKDSNLFLELKEKSYFEKPSKIKNVSIVSGMKDSTTGYIELPMKAYNKAIEILMQNKLNPRG